MTIGGVADMLMSSFAGALIDQTSSKRAYVIIAGICTIMASAIILLSQEFWVVATSQVATAIAGAGIVPAANAINLGIVRQAGFNRKNGRNQAFNHPATARGASVVAGVGISLNSNIINNLPAGLIAGSAVHQAQVPTIVSIAVLIRVDLGPNLSVTGSLATIQWLNVLRRENLEIGAWEFLKLGPIVMLPALFLALGNLMLATS
ncbi:ArsB/NhaD family transporter [Hyphomicrobium sp.]|uniref:ArsB/NhaD family transporter n=1 Tax=Hyphomicrobium sp. TaxID=82 RepID=UPI0035619D65